jgi:DNA-binding response OmpR family regulator
VSQRVLLVEDDHAIRVLLRLLLEDHGYEVQEAVDGPSALRVLEQEVIDLVLLDLRLPGMSGFDVCREVRRANRVPIIIVSAQQDTHDVVAGLELGADDYVTKPFHERELMARIRVQLRSAPPEPTERFLFGDIEIREAEGRVLKSGVDLTLTRTEFRLLCYLAAHEGQVLSRAQLLEAVWDYPSDGDGRLVDTHVARLRAKIETPTTEPPHLVTVRGLGYKLVR